MANGESVFIREIEGESRLEAELGNSTLPEKGLTLGGEQRLVTSHYPGSNRAFTQVMGPREEAIELRGKLRDAWIGQAGGARATMRLLDALRRRGRYCELSWGSTFVVRGFVQAAKFPISRDDDIDYELTFQVDESPDLAEVRTEPFPPVGPDDLHREADALATACRALDAAVQINNLIRGAV